jgi:hypothetical protein
MTSGNGRTSRRGLLSLAAAVGAGSVAGGRVLPAQGTNGDPLILGALNNGTATTTLTASVDGNPSLHVISFSDAKKSSAIAASLNTLKSPSNHPIAVSAVTSSALGFALWGQTLGVASSAAYLESTGDRSVALAAFGDGAASRGAVIQGREEAVQAAGGTAGLSAIGMFPVFTTPTGVDPAGGDALTGVGVRALGTTGVVATASTSSLGEGQRPSFEGVGMQADGSAAGVVGDGGSGEGDTIGVLGRSGLHTTEAVKGAQVEAGVVGLGGNAGVVGAGGPGASLADVAGRRGAAGVVAIGKGPGAVGIAASVDGDNGIGVVAFGGTNVGISTASEGETGVALLAQNLSGKAAVFIGPVAFSQAGRGTFEPGKAIARVRGRRASDTSGIVATLSEPAGPGVVIARARIRKVGTVVVTLNRPAKGRAGFTFLVIDEAEITN